MALGGPFVLGDGYIDYKYKTTLEIEPVFETQFSTKLRLIACLPLRYVYSPAYDYSFDTPVYDTLVTMDDTMSGAIGMPRFNRFSHQTLTLTPGVHLFFTKTPLPLEFKLQWGIPLYVRNGIAMNTLILQMRVYFALPAANR
jgi:hypothetical protein